MKIYIHRKGQTYGPYEREAVEGFIREKRTSLRDWASLEGSEEHVRLEVLLRDEQEDSEDVGEFAETVAKIKMLVESDQEEFAIELVRGLNEPKLYSELLRDCAICEDGTGHLRLPDWIFNDEEDVDHRPFFLQLFEYYPEEADIDASLRRENITSLRLHSCPLKNMPGLNGLTNLTELELWSCPSLTNVHGLSGLTNLTNLYLTCCSSLTNIDALNGLTNLTNLDLAGCSSLTNMDALSGLTNLTYLNLTGCLSLTNMDALCGLTNLTFLNLSHCDSLTNLDGLKGLTNLPRLWMHDCSSLRSVAALSGLTNLTYLNLCECSSLTNDQVKVLRKCLPNCDVEF